jgi:hypothetical protein
MNEQGFNLFKDFVLGNKKRNTQTAKTAKAVVEKRDYKMYKD